MVQIDIGPIEMTGEESERLAWLGLWVDREMRQLLGDQFIDVFCRRGRAAWAQLTSDSQFQIRRCVAAHDLNCSQKVTLPAQPSHDRRCWQSAFEDSLIRKWRILLYCPSAGRALPL